MIDREIFNYCICQHNNDYYGEGQPPGPYGEKVLLIYNDGEKIPASLWNMMGSPHGFAHSYGICDVEERNGELIVEACPTFSDARAEEDARFIRQNYKRAMAERLSWHS